MQLYIKSLYRVMLDEAPKQASAGEHSIGISAINDDGVELYDTTIKNRLKWLAFMIFRM